MNDHLLSQLFVLFFFDRPSVPGGLDFRCRLSAKWGAGDRGGFPPNFSDFFTILKQQLHVTECLARALFGPLNDAKL
jgi:hypothetical protein